MALTINGINLYIQSIETQKRMVETMVSQTIELLTTLNEHLPQAREMAYPQDKSETPQLAKDNFKEFINKITELKRTKRELESKIDGFDKHISSFNYILHNREEAKRFENNDYKVLVIDLNDTNVAPNYSIAAIGDPAQHKTTLLGDTPLEDLKFNIENADKVVTFAREDALEQLQEMGITDATADNKKFTSIHHLMRGYTDFQREGLDTYAEIVGFELTDDNAYNLLRVYMGIVGIETVDSLNEAADYAVNEAIANIKAQQPMIDSLTALVDGMYPNTK